VTPALVTYSPGNQVKGVPAMASWTSSSTSPGSGHGEHEYGDLQEGWTEQVGSSVSLVNDGYVIRIVPQRSWIRARLLVVRQHGHSRPAGLAPSSGAAASFYTGATEDLDNPQTVAIGPPDACPRTYQHRISLRFSEPINPLTVAASTVHVIDGGQAVVPYSFVFSNNNQDVTMTPIAPLLDGPRTPSRCKA